MTEKEEKLRGEQDICTKKKLEHLEKEIKSLKKRTNGDEEEEQKQRRHIKRYR